MYCHWRQQIFESAEDRVAAAMLADVFDVFAVKPGYTFEYYGNVSQRELEAWKGVLVLCDSLIVLRNSECLMPF